MKKEERNMLDFLEGLPLVARLPEQTTGNLLIDFFLGKEKKENFRLLSQKEKDSVSQIGICYFADMGLLDEGEFEDKACGIELSEMGWHEAAYQYKVKYWPAWLVGLSCLWGDFLALPFPQQFFPVAFFLFILALIITYF